MSEEDRIPTNRLAGDIVPLDLLQTSLRRWWLVILFVLIGGLVGWFIFLVQPPFYEASTSILVTVDFVSTGQLTQFEEDAMMDAVGNVLRSTEVIDRTLTKADQSGVHISAQQFKQMSFIERRLGTWIMRIRSRSPEEAMNLANIWAKEGGAALNDAYQHAVTADHLSRYAVSLETCLEKSVNLVPAAAVCIPEDRVNVQEEIQKLSQNLTSERSASRGILPAALIDPPQLSSLPASPVETGRGGYILAGALLGFLVGFVVCQFPLRFRK